MGIMGGQIGDPNAVAFSAGNFTASASMSWTVASTTLNEYISSGGFMRCRINVVNSTVGGTPSTALQVTIPNSATSSEAVQVPCYIIDNSTVAIGFAFTTAGGTLISISKVAGANWSSSTSATTVFVDIMFRIK